MWQNFTKRPEGASRDVAGGLADRCHYPKVGIGSPTRRCLPHPSPHRRLAASPDAHARRLREFRHHQLQPPLLGPNHIPGAKRRGGAACLGVPRLVVVVKSWCSSSRRRRLVDDSSTSRKRRADLDLRPVRPEGHAPEVRWRTPRCEALRREVSSTRGSSENSSVRGSAERGLLNTRFVVVPPRRLTLRCEALRGEVSSTRGSSENSSVRGSTERELLNTRFVA